MTREVDVKALISHLVRGDGTDRCRICMGDTSEGQVYLGDTVMMDGERAVTLAELLEVITGVEVLEDDELPNGLCSTCTGSVADAANFSILCRQSLNRWSETVQLLNHVPLPATLPNLCKAIYAIINNDEMTLINDYKEQSTVKLPEERKVITPINTKSDKDRKKKKPTQVLLCECPNCGKNFRYAHLLAVHLKESSDNLRACHICAKVMSRDDLIMHLLDNHHITMFDCQKCPALFQTHLKYIKHINNAHVRGTCTCGDCGRSFKSQHGFRAHISVHITKKCPACDNIFRNQTCFIHHLKVCCNFKKYKKDARNRTIIEVRNKISMKKIQVGVRGRANTECICDYCGKNFFGKKFIRAHIQNIHMKNTHTPCPYCGKSLPSANMTEHIKTHGSVPQFKCDHCNIILKTRIGFIQHLRLHTGERPYTCKQCGESFSASSRRSEHIRRIHNINPDLKLSCDMCPAHFASPNRLKKHMRTVHNKETEKDMFECKQCGDKFISSRGLVHHSRTHQKDVVQKPGKKYVRLRDPPNV